MTDNRYRRLCDRKAGFGRRLLLPLFVCLAFFCGGCVLAAPPSDPAEAGDYFRTEAADGQDALSAEDAEEVLSSEPRETESVPYGFVYVCGEVVSPGVYEIRPDMRLYEAIALAGGFSGEADSEYLNLALPVSDGMQIRVPSRDETDGRTDVVSGGISSAAGSVQENTGKINLNTASKEELMTLPGVGAARADAIILYRSEHGGFRNIEEICNVSGIKEAIFGKFRELVTVSQ